MNDLRKLIVAAYSANELIPFICQYRSEEESLVQLLGELDHTREIDLIACVTTVKRVPGDTTFFNVKDIFERVLPSLDRNVSQVMNCVTYLFSVANGDGTAGSVFSPYTAFCKIDIRRAQEAVDLAVSEPSRFKILIPSSLAAWSTHDLAGAFARCVVLSADEDAEVGPQGLYGIGSLAFNDQSREVLDRAIKFLVKTMNEETDDIRLAACIHSCASLPNGLTEIAKQWMPTAIRIARPELPRVIHELTTLLFCSCEKIEKDFISELAIKIRSVNSKNSGTIYHVDMALSRLVDLGHERIAIETAEVLVTRKDDPVSPKSLDGFQHSILDKDHLSLVATKWFLKADVVLCRWVLKMVGSIHGNEISIAVDKSLVREGSEDDLMFLSRKSVGYLNSHPITAASMILSCMSLSKNDEYKDELSNLLLNPLLLSYSDKLPKYLLEYLPGCAPEITDRVKLQLAKHDGWLKQLQSMPSHDELLPSENQRREYNQYMSEIVRESMDSESKKSVFMQMVSKTIVLYGDSTSGMMHVGRGKSQRFESKMSNASIDFEVPRLPTLDPWGFDISMRRFRNEKFEP